MRVCRRVSSSIISNATVVDLWVTVKVCVFVGGVLVLGSIRFDFQEKGRQ